MKQTPFYELSVALKDRPRGFQRIVIGSLIFCSLVFLEAIVEVTQDEKMPARQITGSYKKTQPNTIAPVSNMAFRGK